MRHSPRTTQLSRTLRHVRQFYRYLQPHLWLLVIGLICCIAVLSCQLLIPWTIARLIDRALSSKSESLLNLLSCQLLLFTSSAFVFGIARRCSFRHLAVQISLSVQNDILSHFRSLPLSYLSNERCGHVSTLVASETSCYASLYETFLPECFLNVLRLAVTFTIMLKFFHDLVALIFLSVSLLLLFTLPFLSKIQKEALLHRSSVYALAAQLHESISGTREIKMFSRERDDLSRLGALCRVVAQRWIRLSQFQEATSASYLAFWIAATALYWMGGRRILLGNFTIGALTASITYLSIVLEPIASFVASTFYVQAGFLAAEMIMSFLALEPEYDSGRNRLEQESRGVLRLEDVSVSYEGRDDVLRDVTISFEPGAKVAVVGPNGAGKSTLVNLIARLTEPKRGRVTIDGLDIKEISLSTWRERVGIVSHDAFLFSGSIFDNIAFGKPGATFAEVQDAALLADADLFVRGLEGGYDTQIGERGVRLSTGQRQRIAIARVLLKDPEILILDEATSSLDARSEASVLAIIRRIQAGRLTIVVSHHLAAIEDADMTLVMDTGRLIDVGRHGDLLAKSAFYRNLATRGQLRSDTERCKPSSSIELPGAWTPLPS